ncbi:hypothetical protein [Enemella sp. A6]|uniref:hypothetical protein n=1 Tax=Enemella sp. A6 TaxID=3440152 RepID=UPI003EB8F433
MASNARTAVLAALVTVLLFAVGLTVTLLVAGRPGPDASSGVSPRPSGSGVPTSPAPSSSAPSSVGPTTDVPPSREPTESAEPEPNTAAPTRAPRDCRQVSLAGPSAVDPAADLTAVAEEYGVDFEASWYDPGSGVQSVGGLAELPAWSTAKVPLALAVIRSGQGAEYAEAISAALRVSDNEAADRLWRALGPDDAARAEAVREVLREAGDEGTSVPSRRLRPPYSVFGQTRWATADQIGFLRQLPCLEGADQVIAQMRQVSAEQSWALGTMPGAAFKGGWGPTGSGYLVRQFGWYERADGERVLVAIAVQAESFEDGVRVLNALVGAFGRP